MDIQSALGNALKEIRQEQGISQEKFALKIGLDRTYYASVENGKRNVSIQNIEKIANGYDMTVARLFMYVEEMQKREQKQNEEA